MNRGREANEQVEAVENAMDMVTAYMASRAAEEGEIAAQNYLEQWKMIFDTQGEPAARAAMKAVAGYENIKSQMEAYIANGGEEGAVVRGRGTNSDADKKRKEFISDLQAEAQYLRKLADAYEKLEPHLGKETNDKMVELFGEGDYSPESIEQQVMDIVAALRNLGDEGVDAANSLEQFWGLDKFSKLLKQLQKDKKAADDAQKSLNKYLDTIQEWSEKNGEAASPVSNYRKAIDDANARAKKAISELMMGTSDPLELATGYANISGQFARARENALKALRDDLEKSAKDIMDKQLEGYDLTNWNDKTLSQINDIRDAIESITIPDDIKQLILGEDDGEEILKQLTDLIEKLGKEKIDKTIDPERLKKIVKQVTYIAERILLIADALKEFGDASGNGSLSDVGEKISMIAQNVKSAYEGFKVAGPWGAVIGGATDAIAQILGGMTEAEKKAKELRDAIADARVAASGDNFKALLADGVDGIFGSNTIQGIRNAVDGLDEVKGKLRELDEWIAKFRDDAEKYMLFNGGMLYGFLPGGKQNTLIRTKGSSFFSATEEYATIEHLAEQFNRDLFDENGNLNPALLEDILNTYGELNEELTEWLKNGIEYANEYADAMKQIEDAAKSLVGDVVSDVAGRMVDSWWEAGQAALDYSEILEDVAKSYAKLVVQDTLMEAAFGEERRQQLIDALKSGDAETAMATVAGAMRAAQEMLPAVESALQVFEPYRNMGGGESESVGSGIKNITEETANLLASYINAIRSDVSYIRVMQERGWESVNMLGASVPTLNEHLAQIAATNFDIARSNQSILSELQSVIGAPGTSGMVVRVEAS